MNVGVVRARAALLTGAIVAGSLVGGCGKSSPPAHPSPSPKQVASTKLPALGWEHQASGKAAGEQAVQELLAAAIVPPGAQRLSTSPSRYLDEPFTTTADDNFLDHPAWWKVGLSSTDLLAYLQKHVPKGLTSGGSGGGVSGPDQPTMSGLTFSGTGPGDPALQFSVVSSGESTSWLRADGQAIWYPPRPVEETAPTAGAVTLGVSSGPTRKVTDPATVQRLAREFNELIRTTPAKYGGVSCAPNERTLSIAFARTAAAAPTVVASRTECSIGWSVHGPGGELPALQASNNLFADALRLLGVPESALAGPLPSTHP